MRCFILLILTFLGVPAGAQECSLTITGRVLDRATKEPLEFTSMAILEGNLSTMADSLGQFRFSKVCPGQVHLQAYHVGCPPGQFFMEVHRDTQLTLLLDHHGELLKEVTIEGQAGTLQQTQSRQTISASMIRDQTGQSLTEMIEHIPGVRALRNGSGISKPVIHGLFGNRIAVVNNGLLQAGQQWGSDHAPEIDPNAADRITVVKGSDAIEYGSSALGGALLIEAGLIPQDPHLHGSVGYALESNGWGHTLSTRLQTSGGKWDWRLTGTVKKSGDHRAPGYFLTNTGSSEGNGALQVQFRPTEQTLHQGLYTYFSSRIGIFAGAHISNLSDLEDAIGRDRPFRVEDHFSYDLEAPKQHVSHHVLKYSGKRFLAGDRFLEWTYGMQLNHRKEFDIRRGDRTDIPALDLRQWSHTAGIKYIRESGEVHWKSGVQVRWTDNENDYDTGILPLIPDYLRGTVGLYQVVQVPAGKFLLEGGARYDLQAMRVWAISFSTPRVITRRDHLYHDLALSLGLQYRASDDLETRWHNVLARRSPEANELYSNGLHQGIAGIEEGDWTLTPETSWKSLMSQAFQLEGWFHAEANVYSHLIANYIYLRPQDELRLTIRGAFPVYRYEQENVWLRGVDAMVVSDFSHHLEWTLKASWIRGTAMEEQRSLSLIPPFYASSVMSWAFHDHHIWKGSRIQLESTYTARQYHWDSESELLAPPDDYVLFALRFSTGIKLKTNLLHVSVACENVFNQSYRDYLNRLRYFSDETGRSLNVLFRLDF